MGSKVIVKVQTPLMTNCEDGGFALVYNESRDYMVNPPITEEIVKAMAGTPKKFFYADITGDLKLEEEAPWQDW